LVNVGAVISRKIIAAHEMGDTSSGAQITLLNETSGKSSTKISRKESRKKKH
jgi:hypothetical protein